MLEAHGWGDTCTRHNEKAAKGDWSGMASEITDEMLDVFAVTCRHCHTNPDLADGDGGPGTTGGFGFKPRKIDFSSYQGIQSGGVDAHGERVSLFAPTPGLEGLPRLVAAP